jgi:hypothetical protein
MAKGAIGIERTTTTITLVMIRHCRSKRVGEAGRNEKGKKKVKK